MLLLFYSQKSYRHLRWGINADTCGQRYEVYGEKAREMTKNELKDRKKSTVALFVSQRGWPLVSEWGKEQYLLQLDNLVHHGIGHYVETEQKFNISRAQQKRDDDPTGNRTRSMIKNWTRQGLVRNIGVGEYEKLV